ncbi:mapk-regulated corepressor-interacting protein 1 [Microtus ochrogaster]|uniref:Mapk-regulated corepressor-interacting protein 1 n=1 Tax=Microtus ochrogaster TaxID=79684 RepID=A0ABM0KQM4_MICOH|nr:mapk-regulated corepressor-interacting protein 1 [Microtus ochrogaster]
MVAGSPVPLLTKQSWFWGDQPSGWHLSDRGQAQAKVSSRRIQQPSTRTRHPAMTSSPVSRVVYNGKRNSSPRSPTNSSEIFTPAHEENVRFIYEAWQGVERDLRSQLSGGERGLVEEYVEKVPNPSLKTFKPIDLSDLKRRNTQDAKKS